LDPGTYVARCTEASYEWARQWRKWIARLVLEPLNYQGRPYTGRLCKFLGLGKNPQGPYAGPQSNFRQLLVEVYGDQPTRPDVDVEIFAGVLYDIEVETVTLDRDEKRRSPEHWYSIVRAIHPCKEQTPQTPQSVNSGPAHPVTQKTQATHSTDQHSNTTDIPLAEQQNSARAPQKGKSAQKQTGLGSEQIDHKHNYPDERAGGKLSSPLWHNREPDECAED
jgi:hypothetical protein